MELSLSGTKVPEICRSRERKFLGAKVPVTDNARSVLSRSEVRPTAKTFKIVYVNFSVTGRLIHLRNTHKFRGAISSPASLS